MSVMEPLRVLLVREQPLRKGENGKLIPDEAAKPGWVAVCLEHFVVADGETIPEVRLSFEATLLAEILHALQAKQQPLADLKPAPERYQALWQDAEPLANPISVRPPEGSTGPAVAGKTQVKAEVRIAA
ncbi:MAG: hypothetical protein HYY06_19370 [Deltaproteobacteria bacterium]|nr:hypothetical protein [Deltaproteobacteria bacterium]